MFYCEPCGTEQKWPVDWWHPQSYGNCEMCGKTATCFDIPSSYLPSPHPKASAVDNEAKDDEVTQ